MSYVCFIFVRQKYYVVFYMSYDLSESMHPDDITYVYIYIYVYTHIYKERDIDIDMDIDLDIDPDMLPFLPDNRVILAGAYQNFTKRKSDTITIFFVIQICLMFV